MGLLKCGSVGIPFDNQISKDTDLYRLYNTSIHDKVLCQRAVPYELYKGLTFTTIWLEVNPRKKMLEGDLFYSPFSFA